MYDTYLHRVKLNCDTFQKLDVDRSVCRGHLLQPIKTTTNEINVDHARTICYRVDDTRTLLYQRRFKADYLITLLRLTAG